MSRKSAPTLGPSATGAPLSEVVERVAHVLPAQGPITVFIHHNTLHAFEDLPFAEAVKRAARQLGCEPFLSEERYREALGSGRIEAGDIEAVLAAELGTEGLEAVAGVATRHELRRQVASYGIPTADGPALAWLINETRAITRFRRDLPAGALAPRAGADSEGEATAVTALWRACLSAVDRAEVWAPKLPHSTASILGPSLFARGVLIRHRDLIRHAAGVDIDEWVHPLLTRFLAAFLDQGLAYWPMPDRQSGLYACFLDLYGSSSGLLVDAWARRLPALARQDRAAERTALESLAQSLDELGVEAGEREEFLTETALALRGWGGMVRQMEERPDRVPTHPVPATWVDWLAIRLLVDRAAIEYAAVKLLEVPGRLAELRETLRQRLEPPRTSSSAERAWPLFHVAQILGLRADAVSAISAAGVLALERELDEFGPVERRRVLHLAYERRLRHGLYDGLLSRPAGHADGGDPRRRAPGAGRRFQAVFCIDEREESMRRHLEEVEPHAETLGAAGFFGVAMYYRGAVDAHPRPLCPVAVRPEHMVEEVERDDRARTASWRRSGRRTLGRLRRGLLVSSQTLVRGTLLITLLGALAVIPLVLRVLFPRLAHRFERLGSRVTRPSEGQLLLDYREGPVSQGKQFGFRKGEMAEIVARLLEDTGIARRLAPLVLLVGHGSTSLNNPHESAHDCGACGGGRGGPNARAFALMANDPEVRRLLRERGLHIPENTWFVGAEHNTCNDAIAYFDVEAIPAWARNAFGEARAAVDEARRRDAHERCRRFDAVPPRYTAGLALGHVEGRAADLAQPRPEYGHATNAFCVIGRRMRTSGLFLDRRAFLVSYDPTCDDADGGVLARLLEAVVPVVAGISLEYYFCHVDPVGWGCGTKLPHNVACLLGVMDGMSSDLRTGLPWQMVEIHEPVRLTIVVEASVEVLRAVVAANGSIERLVRNGWVHLASLDPGSACVVELTASGPVAYQPERPVAYGGPRSVDVYGGKRGHLPITAIGPERAERAVKAPGPT